MFELTEKRNNVRIGKLHTKSGVIHTPFFMPIATKGAVKNMTPEDLKEIEAQIVLGNTYHLWLRPGDDVVAKAGGLHAFMHWDGPLLTDSGGYQVFSLGARAKSKFGISGVKLSEEGVEFVDPLDGSKHNMSPEKSIDIQLNLGSDMIMVLDECPGFPCSHEDAKKSMELTTRWAARCLEHFKIKTAHLENGKRPLLFAIVQGSIYEDLRKESARQLISMDFDGFAIGGVAVGEPRKHLYDILDWVVPLLPADKPRYLMGLGKPEELVRAVEAGMDMFDCVIPTREGRHGRLFIWKNNSVISHQSLVIKEKAAVNSDDRLLITDDFYHTINIANEQFTQDFSPVDGLCDCSTCQHYTRAYLHHLLRTQEPLFLKLASMHNLRFYMTLMERLKKV